MLLNNTNNVKIIIFNFLNIATVFRPSFWNNEKIDPVLHRYYVDLSVFRFTTEI